MITIIHDKCVKCGVCVEICHESCMTIAHDALTIDYQLCSTCGQCIAICPKEALCWDEIAPERFNETLLPSPEQMDELLKQRRTTRFFNDKKVARALIRELCDYGRYAPSHNFDFRIIAVDDPTMISVIDTIVFKVCKRIYNLLYKPALSRFIIKLLAGSQYPEYLKGQPKLEHSVKIGRTYDSPPPVMIFIIGKKNGVLALESAQYALYTIDLYAQTKGLGCRNLVGNQMFINKNKKLRSLLAIKNNETIYATMGIGYPARRFKNKVQGKTMPLQWNDEIS